MQSRGIKPQRPEHAPTYKRPLDRPVLDWTELTPGKPIQSWTGAAFSPLPRSIQSQTKGLWFG